MPIFISYSHEDKNFVDALAVQLVREHVHVWIDRWELHVGDSLTNRIQEAISGADALLVILSRASVASEWCRRELTAGLVRELEERRVVVMPVVIDDCDIPLFLRDKLYADFRDDFDIGLTAIVESVASVTNHAMARIDEPEWHTDWGIDWAEDNSKAVVRLVMVEHGDGIPLSCLTTISIIGDEQVTEHVRSLRSSGEDALANEEMIGSVANAAAAGAKLTVLLTDSFEKQMYAQVAHFRAGTCSVVVTARRLGEDTGRDTVLHLGDQIIQVHKHITSATRSK